MAAHATWEEIEEAVLSDPGTPIASGSGSNLSAPNGTPAHRGKKVRLDPTQRWRRDDRDLTDLGCERLDDDIKIVKCERCSKPVLARYAAYHKENCDLVLDIKEGRASPSCLEPESRSSKGRLSDVSDTGTSNLDTGGGSTSASPHKKLTKKAAKALEVEERRRQRLEKKARKEREAAETKGRRKKGQPLDVNEQCGVLNEHGQPCMRSLTCKTHSMGAKRSVPGRSRPYDELLLDWQKANNPAFLAKLERREEEKARQMEQRRAAKLEKRRKKEEEQGLTEGGGKKKKKGINAAAAAAAAAAGMAGGAAAGSHTAAVFAEWAASQRGELGGTATENGERPSGSINAAAMAAVNGGLGLDGATLSALLAAGNGASSSSSSSWGGAFGGHANSNANKGPTAVLEEFLEGGPTTDLYAHGMQDSEVDAEISSLLGAMRARGAPPSGTASSSSSMSGGGGGANGKKKSSSSLSSSGSFNQPLPPLPTPLAARRSRLHGTWCGGAKARTRMMLRAAFLGSSNGGNGGSSTDSSLSLGGAGKGANKTTGSMVGGINGGSAAGLSANGGGGGALTHGAQATLPLANGGAGAWGSGIFATSHA